MTQYIPADALAGPTPATSLPAISLMSANPFLSFWMLPLTLTQTWISAWANSDFDLTSHPTQAAHDPLVDHDGSDTPTDQNDQIPVPAPLQDDRDNPVFA